VNLLDVMNLFPSLLLGIMIILVLILLPLINDDTPLVSDERPASEPVQTNDERGT
jgi:hypothetical protein